MSGRFKPYLFILLGILLAAILLNAPVAFASKLPTACNIFNKTANRKIRALRTSGHVFQIPIPSGWIGSRPRRRTSNRQFQNVPE